MANNSYDTFIAEKLNLKTSIDTRPTDAPTEDIYDTILAEKLQRQAQAIRQAGQATPQQHADNLRLSTQSGLPPELVQRNTDAVTLRVQQRSREQFLLDYPALGPSVLNHAPETVGLYQNDLGTLGRLSLSPLFKPRPTAADFPLTPERGFMQAQQELTRAHGQWDQAHRPRSEMWAIDRTWWEEITDPVQRGYAQGRQGFGLLLQDFGVLGGVDAQRGPAAAAHGITYTPAIESAVHLKDQQRKVGRFPVPPEIEVGMQAISNAKTFGAAWDAIVSNPRATGEIILQSLGQSAPAMAGGVASGIVGGPMAAATAVGLGSFTVEYGATLKQVLEENGVDMNNSLGLANALQDKALMAAAREKAIKRGIPIALFDALTAGLAGKILARLAPTRAGVPAGVAGEVVMQAGGGAAGEVTAEVATNEFKPGDILMEAIGEIPTAVPEVWTNYASAKAAVEASAAKNQQTAVSAVDAANMLNAMATQVGTTEAAQLGVEGRSAIAQVLNQMAPDATVSIDARALKGILGEAEFTLDEIVVTAAPWRNHYATALETGADVVIPTGEFLATFAQSPVFPQLLDHVRTSPEAMSRVEAMEYMKTQADTLQAEMEKTLAEKQGDQLFNASRDRVKQLLLDQLNAANRFTPAVNESYAQLHAAHAAVRAAQLGITPEEMYARRPVRVAAEGVGGYGQGSADLAEVLKAYAETGKVAVFRQVDVFGDGSRVDHYDDRKGLMYSRQRMPTGLQKWSVYDTFPLDEGGDQLLGGMFAFDTLEDALASVRAARISASRLARNKAKYGAIPHLWSGEAKRAAKALVDAGIRIDRFSSSAQSRSKYLYTEGGLKIRLSDHSLPAAYDSADIDYRYGGDIAALVAETIAMDGAPTPDSGELDSRASESEMQERSVRADETGSKEPAQSGGGAGSEARLSLPAPNGKPSKLNAHQWAQVRTPEFKAWFGDWELGAQQLRPAENFAQAREAAEAFKGKTLKSADGIEAVVSRNNLDKMLSASAVHKSESTTEHALAVANLDTLFAQAVTGWTKADRDATPEISAIRRMFAPMRVNGKARLVKLTVKEYAQDGNRMYSVEALRVEEGVSPVPEMADADRAEASQPLTGPTGLAESIVQRIQDFNKNGVSKVIDENGEPRVTFKGMPSENWETGEQITEIRSKNGPWAGFFSSDKILAGKFAHAFGSGGIVVPAYISMSRPFVVDAKGGDARDFMFDASTLGKKDYAPARAAIESGDYDGVIIRNTADEGDVYVPKSPTQIKSAIGNTGAFSPDNANILFQTQGPRDDYTLDLFGVPVPDAGGGAVHPSPQGRVPGTLYRDDAEGTYATRTQIVTETTRHLGTRKVSTVEQAAQAMAYLGRGTVEHFDALITDKAGKPLAIVGAFKGAINQASVYPATLIAEAFRVQGAAHIWFAHNHPSGLPELSGADRTLNRTLMDLFLGSAIEAHGIFAIAGKAGEGRQWSFDGGNYSDQTGTTSKPEPGVKVPVVERIFSQEDKLGPMLNTPRIAKSEARRLSGGQPGVILLDFQHTPLAFVPVDPAKVGVLRKEGRMDALYRAISMANASKAIIVNDGQMTTADVQNLAGLFRSLDAQTLDVMETGVSPTVSWAETGRDFGSGRFLQGEGTRGSFDPSTNLISLLKKADLSTFLHESGHFFFENDIALAAELMVKPDITLGEQEIIDDVSRLMTWHRIQGTARMQIAQWYGMDFEEQRAYHERTAEAFEAYLFEGRAPSIELQPYFQKFRAWLLNVYKALKDFLATHPEAGTLTDEVRGVFDRMLATTEEIKLAEQGRSMMPLFETAEQAGMTPEAFRQYQALGVDATQAAIESLQARGLRDMQWLHNARGREIKKLQRQSKERRAEVKMEVRQEILSQPVYRAWQFLTNKLTPDDTIAPIVPRKSVKGPVDPSVDTLFVAIAKMGGIQRRLLESEWGLDPKTENPMPLFGQYVLRREGGRTLDGMAEGLAELGYLSTDAHGKWDLTELEEKFANALGGAPEYAIGVDPAILVETEPRAGDQVVNPEALGAGRLDIGELRLLDLPEAVLQRLVDNRMTATTGLHPDIVAEIVGGFSSGDALVRAVAAAENPRVAVEGLTDQRMLEQYGELATPEAIERSADAAIHNDARARFVAAEANALAKATGKPRILAAAAKAFAIEMIARKRVRDLRPGQYAAAEVRAAKAAVKASKAGDLALAAAEKRNQLINTYATRATYDAQDEVERIVRHFKQLQKTGSQKGMRGEFLVQLNGLLARFDLSARGLPKKPLAEWVLETTDTLSAVAPDLPAWVLDESWQKPYREMTVEEFRGLNDAVRQLEHLARREHSMYKAVRDQTYEQEVAAILEELLAAHPEAFDGEGPREYRKDRLPLVKEWAGRFVSKFDAELVNIENLLDIMTLGKGRSVFESLFGRLSAAADAQTLLMKEMSEYIRPYTRAYTPRERIDFTLNKRQVPGTMRYMTHEQRLAVALFYGSEEGRQRLADGNQLPESDIRAILDTLDERDWALVKALWRLSEEKLWPQLAALNERTVGIAPPKVVAVPIETRYGPMPGGYTPLVYDGDMDTRAHDLNTNSAVQELLGGTATQAATQRSASKTRVAKVNRPLDLSLRAAAYKLNETVHDITFREAIADTYRLLQGKRISNAIRSIAGPDVYKTLLMRVRETAVKPHTPSGFSEKIFWYLRKNTLINMMGASFNTVAINLLGVLPSMRRVGPGRFLAAVGKFTTPQGAERYRWVMDKSLYMRERIQSFDRDMHEELSRLSGKADLMPSLSFWFLGLAAMDRATSLPTWWAAYEQGMERFGNDEIAALDYADRTVRQTHGSGRVVDLAKAAGGVGPAGEFKRIITMFYNFFNAQLGMIRRGAALASHQWGGGHRAQAAAMITLDVLAVIVIPATLEAIARGQCGDDPEAEDYLYCGARASAFFAGGFFPILRDVLPYTWRQFDPEAKGFSVRLSPIENALETMARIPKAAVDTLSGEDTEADQRTLVRGFGYLFGLPGFQTWRTLDGYRALQEGETDNPAVVLTGPPH